MIERSGALTTLGGKQNLVVLAALVLLTLTRGLVWMTAFPPWKICDEPSHFDNVQYRAEVGRAPVDEGKDIPKVMHDGASPELKLSWDATRRYLRGTYLAGQLHVPEEAKLAELARTRENRITDGQASAIGYPGMYYWGATVPYLMFKRSSILVRIMAVRCYSLLFGIVAVVFTYLSALLVLRHRPLAFAAAFIVALQPMVSQQTVAINNDAAVIGLAALIFFLQLYLLQARDPSPLLGLAIGLSLSAIILAKPHGYAMIPGSIVAVGLVLWRQPRSRRAWLLGVLTCLPFFALAGVRIYQLYTAGVLVPTPHQPTEHPGYLEFLNTMGDEYTGWLFKSAWGQFGWLDFSFDGVWLDLIHDVWFVAVCGLVVAGARWVLRDDDSLPLWFSGRLAIFSAATGGLIIFFILFAEYRFRLVGVAHVIQGRAFLFGLPAVAIVACAGLGSLVPARFRELCAAGLCTAALALHLAALVCVVRYHVV